MCSPVLVVVVIMDDSENENARNKEAVNHEIDSFNLS